MILSHNKPVSIRSNKPISICRVLSHQLDGPVVIFEFTGKFVIESAGVSKILPLYMFVWAFLVVTSTSRLYCFICYQVSKSRICIYCSVCLLRTSDLYETAHLQILLNSKVLIETSIFFSVSLSGRILEGWCQFLWWIMAWLITSII